MKSITCALLLIACSASAQVGSNAELHWQIKDNAEVYGFNVYRSTQRTGPFVRVNGDLVRGDEDIESPGRLRNFQFVDSNVQLGKTYYYYVDVVKRSGSSERLTGTLAKKTP